ncbi:MAG: TonB-dependent receptor [Bacteroidales bacterium]|nr:TonB-dependent receptor [Bacteroidales bacterium]
MIPSKRIFLTMILSFVTFLTYAQSDLKGKVIDSGNGEVLIASTVRVMSTDTTKMITGAATLSDGTFNIKKVKDGKYLLKVSYVGYEDFYRPITVAKTKENKGEMTIGTVMLSQKSTMLQEAEVVGQLKEMEMKDDTLIFNADAFKVPAGSVLEDLIKKLPGVTVEDGVVKVNGKTVSRILVGGKEFFGNDQNMSMKNLPAEIVDKVKTYERKSDYSRITGIDDGEEETVIDLSIKKDFQQGWFGNTNLGYGTEELYSLQGQLNRFSEKKQGNVIYNRNNTGSNGNATAQQLGVRYVFDVENFEFGGNIRYNTNKSENWNRNSVERFDVPGRMITDKYSNSYSTNKNRNNSWSGDFKAEWKVDSVTTIQLQPRFTKGDNSSGSLNESFSFISDPYINGVTDPLDAYQATLIPDSIRATDSNSQNWSKGDNYNISANLLINRRLGGNPWFGPSAVTGTNGRNISLRLSGTLSENNSGNNNFSNYTYHLIPSLIDGSDSTRVTYRHRLNPSDNKNYSINVSYSEPILRNLHAQINYTYSYQKRHADGKTFNFGDDATIGRRIWEEYGQYGNLPDNLDEFLSDSLSRYADNINKTHNLDFNLRYNTSLINANAGIRYERQNQHQYQDYLNKVRDNERTFNRITPSFNIRFRFTRRETLQFTWRSNTNQPSMDDLLDLVDSTNVQNIRTGNPNLKPSHTNNLNLRYNNYWEATKRTFNINWTYSVTSNSISTKTEYIDERAGKRKSTPENINGNWNMSANMGFNTPFFWERLTLNTNTSWSFNNRVSYYVQNIYDDSKNIVGHNTLINSVKDHNFGERISLTLRLTDIDVRANGSFNYSRQRSALTENSNQDSYRFSYGLSSTGNFQNGLGYSTDINMSSRRGYSSAAMNTNELIWNAQVSYRFLKRKNATISLEARDILNRRSDISRNISDTQRSDRETHAIYSYVMAHFIYRFNLWGTASARRELREQRAWMDEPDMPQGGGGRGGRGGNGGGGRGNFGGGGGRGGF